MRAEPRFCTLHLLLLLPVLMVAACKAPHVRKSERCFPAEAARWVYVAASADSAVAGQTVGATAPGTAKATIYIDRSASMIGYVKGATRLERPFQDLIGSLPTTLREVGASVEYRGFGTTLGAPEPDGATAFGQVGFYQCRARGDPGCESHLDDVMGRIAAQGNEMAVVLTDLWFDNSEVQTSGLTALQPALTRILGSGRTIAVYGIDAPFNGAIYDLPTSASTAGSIVHSGRHPLFMLVVGRKPQVLQFHEQLGRSGSRLIAGGVTGGAIRRSLFMVDPGPEHPREKAPLDPGARGGELVQQNFEGFGRATIQQFVMGQTPLPRPGGARPASPSWTGPARDAFVDNAVWEGELAPRTRLWRRKDMRCTPDSWIAMGTIDGDWEAVGNGQRRFTLDPGRFFTRARQNGVYLVAGDLTRVTVASPNAADQWMREWSLTPEQAPEAIAHRPVLFPTLNLAEVARIMEGALATAAERDGGGITGFSVLVKVER